MVPIARCRVMIPYRLQHFNSPSVWNEQYLSPLTSEENEGFSILSHSPVPISV